MTDANVVTLPKRAPRAQRVNKTRLGKLYGVSARTIGRWMDEQCWRPGTPPPPGSKSAYIPESFQQVPSSAESAPTRVPTPAPTSAPTRLSEFFEDPDAVLVIGIILFPFVLAAALVLSYLTGGLK